ncbi:MAG: DUF547 domain-containing protein [Vicingaceae bacterium]
MKRALLLFFIILVVNRLTGQSNVAYNDLLKKYVSAEGKVNYKGFIVERDKFEAYLAHLSKYPPTSNWNRQERMAFWINAYNAFTIKLIIDHYPVESITDLHPLFYIPGFNSVWHEEFFKIGDQDFSLHRIEHEILRPEFKDARIHFAINCASFSCPILRNEAYEANKLDAQLEDQARMFINDSRRNLIRPERPQISEIFSWFKSDFENRGGVIPFINTYSKIKINQGARLSYLSYDWSLNH